MDVKINRIEATIIFEDGFEQNARITNEESIRIVYKEVMKNLSKYLKVVGSE